MALEQRAQRGRAVVTGASSGIGAAIARRLAVEGAHVLLVARDVRALERIAAEIAANGGEAACCAIDLADRDAAGTVVETALRQLGGLDILVNCASLTRNEDFFQLTDDHWQDAFEVKVFAAIRLCRTAWPALQQARGSIVNICGIGARTPTPQTAITAASSAALMAITKVLAQAGVRDGVQVNAINPGLVRTPRIEHTIAGHAAGDAAIDAALDQVAQRMGIVRAGRPDDVAALVAYIVSAAGEMLQGAVIDLDGGATKGL